MVFGLNFCFPRALFFFFFFFFLLRRDLKADLEEGFVILSSQNYCREGECGDEPKKGGGRGREEDKK